MSTTISNAPVAMPVEAKKPIKKTKAAKPAGGAKKAKPNHPAWAEMMTNAVKDLHERGGSSIPAIKKYLMTKYKVDSDKANPFIRRGLQTALTSGSLVQVKGKGLTGSFKLGNIKAKPAMTSGTKKAVKPAGEKLKTKKLASPKKATPAKPKAVSKKVVAAKPTAAKPKAASPSKKVAKKPVKKVAPAKPTAAKKAASPKKVGVKSKSAKTLKAPKVPKPKSTKKVATKTKAVPAPKKQ